MPAYSVRNVKSFDGRNGPGFSCTLYNGGRKVADVVNDANGGAFRFHWHRTRDEAMLEDYVATLPPVSLEPYARGTAPQNRDGYLAELVERYENAARFRRLLGAKVVLLLDGQVRTYNARPTADVLAGAARKWPTAQVLNTLPRDEAVALMLAHAATR